VTGKISHVKQNLKVNKKTKKPQEEEEQRTGDRP
jgi:hypothetical protein